MFKQTYAPSKGSIGAYAGQDVILVTGGRVIFTKHLIPCISKPYKYCYFSRHVRAQETKVMLVKQTMFFN